MLTPEQRQLRKRYIGSSDAAAIMCLDPYRSAADVWMDKTGKLDEGKSNDAMDAGNLLEGAVLDWFEQQHGTTLQRHGSFYRGQRCANLDAYEPATCEIVEAKTTGITGPANPAYGNPETDEVPDNVIVQTHHQFGVCGDAFGVAWVPVLIGGRGFVKYRLDRNGELVEQIALQVESFWTQYVQRDIRPDDFRPSLETLKRVRREPASVVTVPNEIAESLIVARAARLQSEKDEEAAQVALLAAMGTAEAAEFDGGRITYLEYARKGYTKIVEPSTFRKFGFPKAQKRVKQQHTQMERIAI